MQKWYPNKWPKWFPKGTPKVKPNHQNGLQKPPQNGFPKKHPKMMIFSTLECGSCVVNNNNIRYFHILMLTPFWVSFWRSFGSPNGGQSHQKAISKKHQKRDPKHEPNVVPKGVPKRSQNHQKWGLGGTLLQGWFPSGLQNPSRSDFGKVWGLFREHFSQLFEPCFFDLCKRSLASCCNQRRSKPQGVIRKTSREGVRSSFSLREILHQKAH